VVDFQARLMPAIEDGAAAVANARRLLAAADMLGVPVLFTEQNARGLGPTHHQRTPPKRQGAASNRTRWSSGPVVRRPA
jgi:nicotinamidase-related amidase